ncbi:hypothetical protein PORY_000581 [Pneumocystis oryctolagi]|uniref:Uncharacterized protein n=1 Tax=Pneumocystis oryctolagi TaxID=42067 RepID=A0ACB7CH97_9ASCO|nr:hypothetical protein PORY_000581 [Pneumocystis oryctolagi]
MAVDKHVRILLKKTNKMVLLVLKVDPAIEQYAEMRSLQYMYFRWTPKTVTKTVILGLVVPLFVGYLAFATEGKWSFRGKGINDKLTDNHNK